jgi:hypothetical protein
VSLFGPKKNPNLEQVARAVHDNLGLTLLQPDDEVLRVLDEMTHRELVNFDNAHSIEGMQELFRAKSIRAVADVSLMTVSLFVQPREEIEKQLQDEHTHTRTIHVGDRHATQQIVRPPEIAEPIKPQPAGPPLSAEVSAPVPPAFEHLEAVERLLPTIVDLFLKHGQLNTGDKEVLKKILPTGSSLEARIVALERWRDEVTRRVRALAVPKATQHLTLAGETETQEKPEETLTRRFDALIIWLGKLIKAFESTGVKYHNKPMWLPH